MRRALELKSMLALGIRLDLDDFDAEELRAVMIVGQEQDRLNEEKNRET